MKQIYNIHYAKIWGRTKWLWFFHPQWNGIYILKEYKKSISSITYVLVTLLSMANLKWNKYHKKIAMIPNWTEYYGYNCCGFHISRCQESLFFRLRQWYHQHWYGIPIDRVHLGASRVGRRRRRWHCRWHCCETDLVVCLGCSSHFCSNGKFVHRCPLRQQFSHILWRQIRTLSLLQLLNASVSISVDVER